MALGFGNKKERSINKLPDEIVLSILSLLPMNQVARSALVSRKWDHCWRHIHVLNFDNRITFKKMVDEVDDLRNYAELVNKGRCNFVNWVNNVLNNHLGCTLDEFKLFFYLNEIYQHVIDGWVVWAFSKHVERLQLDFTPPCGIYEIIIAEKHQYVLDLPILVSCNTKFHLTSLCLKSVNVTTHAIDCFLKTCGPTLDNLCVEKSYVLTRIAAASLPSLKYCKVFDCPNLEAIDIQAPKLVCFKYFSGWRPVMRLFNIENASTLSRVCIKVLDGGCFVYVFSCLFKYFPHLEYLKLSCFKNTTVNPVFVNFPVLGNLKYLKFFACLAIEQTLDAWVPFIGACPLLQKLTLKLGGRWLPLGAKNENHDRCPLLHLKTLEIRMFTGYNVDLDIANFVLQNATALQEVIVYPCEGPLIRLNLEAPLADLGLTLPPQVNVVVVRPHHNPSV